MSIFVPASIPIRTDEHLGRVENWKGGQGHAWAVRNPVTVEALDKNYAERFGVTRTQVNCEMLVGVPRDATVLEVGCSAGAQLNAMEAAGFSNLFGCDLSADAVKMCRWPAIVADGTQLPFEDASVDLVMTSGTLMQIPPHQKERFVGELRRVARRWIYGVEMWTEHETVWDFGDLMPPAWTLDWPNWLPRFGWPITRADWLRYRSPTAPPLYAYVLERP